MLTYVLFLLQHMNNFAEFVKAFCDFGQEMVELSVTTRWHLNQVRWSVQMVNSVHSNV